ncbi:hypothetical protein HYN48_13220 [Flavobacterium magnum]|uniref:Uncharacterized protein n=1 Tax=Flavobacterium magnum TaxID=2162713 RepID=A0A2S0RI73_9FLAO|nr:hypothetical protein [Flavobacterium magnum]AWA30960.1 hypothetical protein HYN48_13220 [Flavobacterium magnum]
MAKKTIFVDDDNNEMEVFVNQNGKLFIQVGQLKEEHYSGFITLDKTDVEELINMLTELKEEVED